MRTEFSLKMFKHGYALEKDIVRRPLFKSTEDF